MEAKLASLNYHIPPAFQARSALGVGKTADEPDHSFLLFPLRPALRAEAPHETPLPAAAKGGRAGRCCAALLAMSRHGPCHVHQCDARTDLFLHRGPAPGA